MVDTGDDRRFGCECLMRGRRSVTELPLATPQADSDKGLLPVGLDEYLELLDGTAGTIREGQGEPLPERPKNVQSARSGRWCAGAARIRDGSVCGATGIPVPTFLD